MSLAWWFGGIGWVIAQHLYVFLAVGLVGYLAYRRFARRASLEGEILPEVARQLRFEYRHFRNPPIRGFIRDCMVSVLAGEPRTAPSKALDAMAPVGAMDLLVSVAAASAPGILDMSPRKRIAEIRASRPVFVPPEIAAAAKNPLTLYLSLLVDHDSFPHVVDLLARARLEKDVLSCTYPASVDAPHTSATMVHRLIELLTEAYEKLLWDHARWLAFLESGLLSANPGWARAWYLRLWQNAGHPAAAVSSVCESLLDDADAFVRIEAARTCAKTGPERLWAYTDVALFPDLLRATALHYLRASPRPPSVEQLVSLIPGARPLLAREVAAGLGATRGGEAERALIGLLSYSGPDVVLEAIAGLAECGHEASVLPIRTCALAENAGPAIVEAATRALNGIQLRLSNRDAGRVSLAPMAAESGQVSVTSQGMLSEVED